jgi:hypothetical protein
MRQKKCHTRLAGLAACLLAVTMGLTSVQPALAEEETVYCGLQEHAHDASCYTDDSDDLQQSLPEASQTTQTQSGKTGTDDTLQAQYQSTEGDSDQSTETETENLEINAADPSAQTELVCGLEEHVHSAQCYSDPDADLVDKEAMNISESLSASEIAQMQTGYAESTRNYLVNENSEQKGYSKYGAYFDKPYADWNADFARYIYLQAEDALSVYLSGNAQDDFNALAAAGLIEESAAEKDDLVFLKDSDGNLIEAIALDANSAIAGDYADRVETISTANMIAKAAAQKEITLQQVKALQSAYETAPAEQSETAAEVNAVQLPSEDEAAETAEQEDETLAAYPSLTPYITSVGVYQSKDQVWIPVTSVTNGQSVMAKVNFAVPDGIISETNRTFTYDLPDSFKIPEGTNGILKNQDNEPEGTFTVNSKGQVVVTFSKEFASNSEGFTGDFKVIGTITENNEETHNITFPGSSTTINVKPHSALPDLSAAKTGVYKKDGKVIGYTVTLSSENGTGGEDVSVYDGIDSSDGVKLASDYDFGSVTVEKVLADGQTEQVTGFSKFPVGTETGPGIYLMGLPPLKAGEKYIIHYDLGCKLNQTKVNGKVVNTVTGYAGQLQSSATNTTTIDQPLVHKEGTVDTVNKTVDWTVTLDPAGGQDLQGSVLDDSLPDGMKLVPGSSITVTDEQGQVVQTESSFPFTISSDSVLPLTVTYKTTLGNLTSGESATNTATLTDQGVAYEGSGTVTLGDYGWKIQKDFGGTVSSENGIVTYKWDVSSYLDNEPLSKFSFTDTISDLTDGSQTYVGSQYTTVATLQSELEQNLVMQIWSGKYSSIEAGWNNDMGITFHLTCMNADGQVVTGADDKVASFTLSASGGDDLDVKYLSLQYTTTADMNLVPSGTTVTAQNTAETEGASSSAKTTYTVPGKLSKAVQAPDGSYDTGDQVMSYSDTNGVLTYQIKVPVDKAENITLTDTLNTDLQIKTYNAQVEYNANDIVDEIDGNYVESYAMPMPGTQDGKTVMTIDIDGAGILALTRQPVTLIITYTIDIASDPSWDDPMHLSSTYENTVTVGDETASTSTKVEKPEPDAAKYATVIGQPDSVYFNIEYDVLINPGAKDLSDTGVLDVTDTLSKVNGVQAELMLNTVKVYHYDPDAASRLGEPLDSDLYSFTYDDTTQQIKLQVPDGEALVLVYEYRIANNRAAPAPLENSVSVNGKEASKTSTKVEQVAASGSVQRYQLVLYKVQSDDYNIRLSGVDFSLQQYDPQTGTWSTIIDKLTTDSQGMITLDSTANLQPDTLYRFVELKYPDGYTHTDNGDQYTEFVINQAETPSEDTRQTLINEGVPESLLTNVIYTNIAGGNMYVENKKTTLTVSKVWLDEYGDTLDSDRIPVDSVTFSLLSSTEKDEADATPVEGSQQIADASNNWTCTWHNLPETNDQGEKLYYFVKEDTTSILWQASALNNTGDGHGSVTYVNKLTGNVTLPSTGDKGVYTGMFTALALVLCGAAVMRYGRKGESR